MAKDSYQLLYTSEGSALDRNDIPWNVYPRPRLVRGESPNDTWINLNGQWEFRSDRNKCKILVPFCPECLLSGLEEAVTYDEKLHYMRTFGIAALDPNGRILLHFGAVSRDVAVYVNDIEVATHDNAYLPFSADITEAVRPGINYLELIVKNDLSHKFPWGKQKKKRGGMWYTPVSGIWQTVWMEFVPDNYIMDVKTEMDDKAGYLTLITEKPVNAVAVCEGREYPFVNGKVRIAPEKRHLWSPEDPYLYNVEIKTDNDYVRTYFALRKLEVKEVDGIKRLCLNGEPYFFHGVLDQGYYSDGLYTPATPALYEQDILRMKALGFNMLRKHIKVEPEQFYYDCDRLGMIVFQDMVNNGIYNYLFDTVLPNFGYPGGDRPENARPSYRKRFRDAMKRTVAHLSSFPCICYWTIFNEGWGQYDADGAYELLKDQDHTRFVDATSGWFKRKKSDVESLHIYFKKLFLSEDFSTPQIISEFGGFVYKDPEHSFNKLSTYGYKILLSREDFVKDLRRLYTEEVVPLVKKGLCGTVYTQVSDVEDETNGLLTYDRRVEKVLPEEFSDIAEMLKNALNPIVEEQEV